MKDMSEHIPPLVDWLAQGRTQQDFCEINNIPPSTLERFIARSDLIQAELMRARARGAVAEAESIVQIADNPNISPKQARNMIDVRKWRASKFLPKVFGERVDVNVTQTVDLSNTLIEARKRALQPACNLQALPETQDADYVLIPAPARTDNESVSRPDSDPYDVFD